MTDDDDAPMDQDQTKQAMSALARWFKSQDIGPKNACSLMIELCGGMLAVSAKSQPDLQDGIDAADALLSLTAMRVFTNRLKGKR